MYIESWLIHALSLNQQRCHRLQAHNINVGQAKHARIIQQEVANTQTGVEPAELAGGIDVARPD